MKAQYVYNQANNTAFNQYSNEQQMQPMMAPMGLPQVNMDTIEQLQNFDKLPVDPIDSRILYLLCLLHKGGQISAM